MLDFISAILAALRVFFRGRRDSALEILALRQQLAYSNEKINEQRERLFEPVSPWPRTRRSRGRYSHQNSDASLPSRKWAVSITVTSGAQPENGGVAIVRAEEMCHYGRSLPGEAHRH